MSYPLPIAETPEIEKVRTLYRVRYGVNLTFEEAKRFLEEVMQFIYLTEVEPKLLSIRQIDHNNKPDPPQKRIMRPQKIGSKAHNTVIDY